MNPQPSPEHPTEPGHPPTHHYPAPPGYAPAPGGGQQAPQRPRRKRTVIVAVAAVALLAIVGVPAAVDALEPTGAKDLGSGSVTDPLKWWVNVPAGDVKHYSTDVPGLIPGPSVDDAALAQVDPRQLYWAMLARQGTRQVTDMIIHFWNTPEEYHDEFPADSLTRRSATDWRTRAFIHDTFDMSEDGTLAERSVVVRCIGSGQQAAFYQANEIFGTPARWEVRPASTSVGSICSNRMKPNKLVANSGVTDSIAPAGLTPEQMNAFISYLDGVPGLIEVALPTSVRSQDGKQYIQLDVALVPQDPRCDVGARMGAAFLYAAFAQTGNDPHAYPYDIGSNEGQGHVIRYFIDPQTLLPAYAAMSYTSPLGLDGTPISDLPNSYSLYQYSWPDGLDPAALRAEGIPYSEPRPWPFEKIVF